LIGMIERCREGHRLCKIYKIATTGELQHLPPSSTPRPALPYRAIASLKSQVSTSHFSEVLLFRAPTLLCMWLYTAALVKYGGYGRRTIAYSLSSHADRRWDVYSPQGSLYARVLDGRKTTRSAVPRIKLPLFFFFASFRLSLVLFSWFSSVHKPGSVPRSLGKRR
jgi:hypothetical protein